jgi:hypothetical protein
MDTITRMRYGFQQPRVVPMRNILAGGVERIGSMSRNRATAKQRKQQQYRYGYRASSQRTQGETAPEAFKSFAAEERCAERARLAEELAHAVMREIAGITASQ